MSETSFSPGADLPTGRWGHRGVLVAMCLALILVVVNRPGSDGDLVQATSASEATVSR